MAEDLFKTLHQDHEEVKSIFKKAEAAKSPSEMKSLVEELRKELLPHMAGEEQAVYPSLKGISQTKEDVLESVEEHRAARTQLEEIMRTDPSDETFKAKITVLREMIEHHVQEEEDKIFQDLREHKSSDELDQMLSGFNSGKERAKSTTH